MLTFSTFLHIIIMNLYVGVMYMKEINYKKIGERLRKLRKYMGLTQEQVAEILSVGRDAILRIEKGDRKIDLQELISFSKLYNISMDELTTEEHTINSSDVAFARGFNELSEKDKKEIISLIEYKNILILPCCFTQIGVTIIFGFTSYSFKLESSVYILI